MSRNYTYEEKRDLIATLSDKRGTTAVVNRKTAHFSIFKGSVPAEYRYSLMDAKVRWKPYFNFENAKVMEKRNKGCKVCCFSMPNAYIELRFQEDESWYKGNLTPEQEAHGAYYIDYRMGLFFRVSALTTTLGYVFAALGEQRDEMLEQCKCKS